MCTIPNEIVFYSTCINVGQTDVHALYRRSQEGLVGARAKATEVFYGLPQSIGVQPSETHVTLKCSEKAISICRM